VGGCVVPRAEDRLAPRRRLALALPLAAVALAGCGGGGYTNVTFRNDLPRPVQLERCSDRQCLHVAWTIGIDPRQEATEPIASDGSGAPFVVVGPPDTIFGCLRFRFASPRAPLTVPLSQAHPRSCWS
jgi:hypothetical protein